METLKFIHCELDRDVDETFLSQCRKLKRLYVRDTGYNGKQRKIFIGTTNNWLKKQYASLEHFEVNSQRKIDEVIHFVRRNSNIRTFSTTLDFLVANLDSISTSNIKLDVLAILHSGMKIDEIQFNIFVKRLIELQHDGLFQHLHLYFYRTTWTYTYPSALLPLIRILHITHVMQKFTLSSMINLQQLYLMNTVQIDDRIASLQKLEKLDYINFSYEEIDNILPFLKLPNLSKIKIDSIKNEKNIFNISQLNEARGMSANGSNLTIYVKENIYLSTIKALTETMPIRILRHESYGGSHDFTDVLGNIS